MEDPRPLPGGLIGSSHHYRIDWLSDRVVYSIDGIVVHTRVAAITGDMRPLVSDYNTGGPTVSVDWIRMTPYAASGTFTSRVIDAGGPATWDTITAGIAAPATTTWTLEARSGNSPDPADGTWSPFVTVANGANLAVAGRYMQYRVAMSTTDPTSTPELRQVRIGYVIG
jgi:hypothetical protein